MRELAAILAAPLLLTSCGGDGAATSTSSPTAADTTMPPATTLSPTTAPPTTGATDGTSTSTAATTTSPATTIPATTAPPTTTAPTTTAAPTTTVATTTTVREPATFVVTMIDDQFVNASPTIRAGDRVVWVNEGMNPHTATANDDSWGSNFLLNGQSWSTTFDQPGTYSYFCIPHPQMVGTITVTE